MRRLHWITRRQCIRATIKAARSDRLGIYTGTGSRRCTGADYINSTGSNRLTTSGCCVCTRLRSRSGSSHISSSTSEYIIRWSSRSWTTAVVSYLTTDRCSGIRHTGATSIGLHVTRDRACVFSTADHTSILSLIAHRIGHFSTCYWIALGSLSNLLSRNTSCILEGISIANTRWIDTIRVVYCVPKEVGIFTSRNCTDSLSLV